MSRRAYADTYEHDYQSGPRERDYDELDIIRRREPDLPVAKVSREREYEEVDIVRRREAERPPPRPSRERDYDEIDIIRRREPETPAPASRRQRDYDEIDVIRHRAPEPEPELQPKARTTTRVREREYEEVDVIRRRQSEPQLAPPARPRERDYDEIDIIQRRERTPERPRRPARERDYDEVDIIRRSDRAPDQPPPARRQAPVRERDYDEIDIIRRRERTPDPPRRAPARERERERDYEEIDIIHRRERTPEKPRRPVRERDYDEIDIIRRREGKEREQPEFLREDYGKTDSGPLVVRQREREVETFAPPPRRRSPTPEPPKEPPVIQKPTIHQEIVTHHRHIDHGIERLRSPSPPPPPPPAPRRKSPPVRTVEREIEIETRTSRGGREVRDDEIIYERKTTREDRDDRDERPRRGRSVGDVGQRQPRSGNDDAVAAEAEYYNRRMKERGYIGEAYNGATRDWTIVDVPPGTQRVTMDSVGGASEEITWQRYNGVRRSNFIPEREREVELYDHSREERPSRRYVAERDRHSGMWTEITKDLVVREALEELGYEFDETEFFFYVMDYLRYEDVLELVEISQDIRRDRHERILEIQWERDHVPPLPPLLSAPRRPMIDEKRVVEREVVYEGRRPRYH